MYKIEVQDNDIRSLWRPAELITTDYYCVEAAVAAVHKHGHDCCTYRVKEVNVVRIIRWKPPAAGSWDTKVINHA